MDVAMPGKTSPLLKLPLEIRCQILDEVFFRDNKWNLRYHKHFGSEATLSTLRHVELGLRYSSTYFDTSIIRTCKQLQREAESLLYSHSLWTLDGELQTLGAHPLLYATCALEMLAPRLRGVIRRFEVIMRFYDNPTVSIVSMVSLAQACPKLPCQPGWTFYSGKLWDLTEQEWKHPLKGSEESPGQVLGILQTKKQISSIVEMDEILSYLQVHFVKVSRWEGELDEHYRYAYDILARR